MRSAPHPPFYCAPHLPSGISTLFAANLSIETTGVGRGALWSSGIIAGLATLSFFFGCGNLCFACIGSIGSPSASAGKTDVQEDANKKSHEAFRVGMWLYLLAVNINSWSAVTHVGHIAGQAAGQAAQVARSAAMLTALVSVSASFIFTCRSRTSSTNGGNCALNEAVFIGLGCAAVAGAIDAFPPLNMTVTVDGATRSLCDITQCAPYTIMGIFTTISAVAFIVGAYFANAMTREEGAAGLQDSYSSIGEVA